MIEVVKTVVGLALLSFSLVYGMYYLGLAMDAIIAANELDWEWD
tara:strand:- start:165 stop:296 length:132 start_codon:yes stop_codon:yes gene_type:complete